MRHFPAAKADSYLTLVAFGKKSRQVANLDIVIPNIRAGPELDFLKLDLLLLFTRRLGFFILLKPEFAIIHNPANRGLGFRYDLNQVQAICFRGLNSLTDRNNTLIFSVLINQPDFGRRYIPVNAMLFLCRNTLILQNNIAACRNLLREERHQLFERHGTHILTGSRTYGHGIRFKLFVPHHQLVRNTL